MIVNTQLAQSLGHLQKDLWETPDWLFKELDDEFHFTLDPCCEIHNARCVKFFTPKEDGLLQSWKDEIVFVNPPYSRKLIKLWVEKCVDERFRARQIVALLPVSTSSVWFHQYVAPYSILRFLKGRVRFKGAPFTAPFSSMVAVF